MVYAAPSVTPIGSTAPVVNGDPITNLAAGILPILSLIIGVIAVLYVIYSGYRYMVAGGDTKKTAEARAGLVSGIIGIIIIALTYKIISLSIKAGEALTDKNTGTTSSSSKAPATATSSGYYHEEDTVKLTP